MNLSHCIIRQQLSETEQDYLMVKTDTLRSFDMSDAAVHKVLRLYQQPHRFYHNLSHLYNLFTIADTLLLKDRQTFELAIWMHDVIYQPMYKNNEERSVQFMKKVLQNATSTIKNEQLQWLEKTIISTSNHQPLLDDTDLKIFLDLDLSILAAPPAIYEQYVAAIRKEYRMYPDFLYKKGRKKVLQNFLNRKQLFFSEPFQTLETTARNNLEKEILSLTITF